MSDEQGCEPTVEEYEPDADDEAHAYEPTEEELDEVQDWVETVAYEELRADRSNRSVRWSRALPIRQVVGERVRALREASGVRQEQLAECARVFGLPWARSSVTTLEAGGRNLSIEEFALLPAILSRACGRTITLAELLPASVDLQLGPRVAAHGEELRRVLAGEDVYPEPSTDPEVYRWPESLPSVVSRHLRSLWPNLPREQFDRAMERPTQEPDQKAARKLTAALGRTVTPRLVAVASEALWGRSIAEQRDSAAADVGVPESRRSQQTALGHITRRLLIQLEAEIVAAEKCSTTRTRKATDGSR